MHKLSLSLSLSPIMSKKCISFLYLFLSLPRVRPKPPSEKVEFPDTPLPLPDEPVKGEARYGTRQYWFS